MMLSERLSRDRRTKRRRRIGVLVVLIVATALFAAVPAVGQQEAQDSSQEDASQQSATEPDKKEGDISTQSFTQKAAFTSGSGATFLRVAVSDAGNLLHFESPQAKQSVARE